MSEPDVLAENERLASRLAAALVGEARAHVIVSPGSRSTPLALAFDAHPHCEVQVVLDERAAAFIALGVARATGEPAIVLATSGSAGAHHYPAVVEANVGRVPLLIVTADRPGELHDCGAPQTMPQRALFGEHVRLSVSLPEPDAALTDRWIQVTGARARAAALGSPPGPVHLNVPFREPLYDPAREPHVVAHGPVATWTRGKLRLADIDVRALAEDLASAASGAIVCGPLAPATIDPVAFAAAVGALASRLGWPVIADATSGLRFGPHDRSTLIASGDALVRDPEAFSALRVERVLRFGQTPTTKALGRWVASHAGNVWLVDGDGEWLDGGGIASRLVIADPTELARDLVAALPASPNASAVAHGSRFLRADAAARKALSAQARDGEWEGRVVRELLDVLPSGARLHVASSMPVRDLDSFGGTREAALRVTSNRGVNGIDGTLATALGIALATRAPTVALLGDLSYLHDLDGLEAAGALAATPGLSLVFVVVDNGGGGIFGELPIAKHPSAFERLFLTPRPGDLDGVTRALRVPCESASPSSLGEMLRVALAKGGIGMLHVRVDRSDSSSRRRRALDEAARLALEEMGT